MRHRHRVAAVPRSRVPGCRRGAGRADGRGGPPTRGERRRRAIRNLDGSADPFDLVVSAQAWHWVDQNIGPTAAADALRPGGRLALFSNGYEEVSLRDELDAVYRQHAPQIVAKTFVLGRHTPTLRSAHAGPIEACGRFGPVEERSFQWEHTYTRDEWLDQLPTHSDHRTLRPEVLSTLLRHIRAVIDVNGGTLTIGHTTELLFAARH